MPDRISPSRNTDPEVVWLRALWNSSRLEIMRRFHFSIRSPRRTPARSAGPPAVTACTSRMPSSASKACSRTSICRRQGDFKPLQPHPNRCSGDQINGMCSKLWTTHGCDSLHSSHLQHVRKGVAEGLRLTMVSVHHKPFLGQQPKQRMQPQPTASSAHAALLSIIPKNGGSHPKSSNTCIMLDIHFLCPLQTRLRGACRKGVQRRSGFAG